MTHRYIGTKEVTAWTAAMDGEAGYGVKYEDGYTSWSPKDAFEKAYRTSEPGMPQALTFGDALHYLKLGKKVARAGWNGAKPLLTRFVPVDRDPIVFEGLTHIKLDDGSVAICDESALSLVEGKTWWRTKGGYAAFTNDNGDGTRSTVKLHQVLNPLWEITDHDNGDRMDNRSANLRQCTTQENNFNRAATHATSKFKGVSWDSSRNKWIVSIMHNGRTKHIGRFDDEHKAAEAYDIKATELFGEFAKLNFPKPRMFLEVVRPVSAASDSDAGYVVSGGSPDELGLHLLPWIGMKTADSGFVPWLCSQTDALAEDWEVLKD